MTYISNFQKKSDNEYVKNPIGKVGGFEFNTITQEIFVALSCPIHVNMSILLNTDIIATSIKEVLNYWFTMHRVFCVLRPD